VHAFLGISSIGGGAGYRKRKGNRKRGGIVWIAGSILRLIITSLAVDHSAFKKRSISKKKKEKRKEDAFRGRKIERRQVSRRADLKKEVKKEMRPKKGRQVSQRTISLPLGFHYQPRKSGGFLGGKSAFALKKEKT